MSFSSVSRLITNAGPPQLKAMRVPSGAVNGAPTLAISLSHSPIGEAEAAFLIVLHCLIDAVPDARPVRFVLKTHLLEHLVALILRRRRKVCASNRRRRERQADADSHALP